MKIIIPGRIPSKKNSRITVRKTGRSFPSAKYKAWHREASKHIKDNIKGAMIERCKVTLSFYAPDKRATDLSNKTESIMDLLVDNKVIKDDNWFVCPNVHMIFKEIDRTNPRCEVIIKEC